MDNTNDNRKLDDLSRKVEEILFDLGFEKLRFRVYIKDGLYCGTGIIEDICLILDYAYSPEEDEASLYEIYDKYPLNVDEAALLKKVRTDVLRVLDRHKAGYIPDSIENKKRAREKNAVVIMDKIKQQFLDEGFAEIEINGRINYVKNELYCIPHYFISFSCFLVEYASDLNEAEKNLYEDGDLFAERLGADMILFLISQEVRNALNLRS